MKRPAMRGTQPEAIPRYRSTWNLAIFARPTRSPSSQEPGDNGAGQRQPSPDVLRRSHHLISADPTRYDLVGRTQSLCNGDGQRTNSGHIPLLQGIEPDNHRSDGDKHLSMRRYSSCQRHVSGTQIAWLVT